MSASQRPNPVQSQQRFYGFNLLAGWSLLAAALVSGLIIAAATSSIGWSYYLLFAVASLAVTILTKPRNLFLTVASIPLMFAVTTVSTGWILVRQSLADGAPVSKTQYLSAVYPLTQHFPILILVSIGCLSIAFLRIRLLKQQDRKRQARTRDAQRRERQESERNQTAARKARLRAQQPTEQRHDEELTVTELVQRRGARRTSAPRQHQRRVRTDQTNGGTRHTLSDDRRAARPPRRTMPQQEPRTRSSSARSEHSPRQQRPSRRPSFRDDLYRNDS